MRTYLPRTAPRAFVLTLAVLTAAVTAAASVLVAAGPAGAASGPSATSPLVPNSGCSTHTLPRNDDGSTGLVSLPFKLNFYNRVYTALYVNNNGNVTFQVPMSTYTPFTINADTPPIIAPFFADVDTRATLSHPTTYGVTTFQGRAAFCVNWSHVGYFSERVDKTDSFQLLLVQTNSQGDFDIVFNYGSLTWETGEASGGTDGLGGTSAGAGFSNGDGNAAHYQQLDGSLQPGALLNGGPDALASHSNTSPAVPGRYVFHIASGAQVSAAQTCTPYYFISVAGSGEHPEQGLDGSPETKIVYEALRAARPASADNITFYQVPYQALGTNVLMQNVTWRNVKHQLFDVNLPKYLGSINDGVAKLAGYITGIRFQCFPQHIDPKFFLVGYSQGALVIHEYLLGQVSDPTLPPQIGFVGLIADPAAVAGRTELINWGTSDDTRDYGICHEVSNIFDDTCGTNAQDIPPAFQHRTESVCNTDDVVCSTSTLTAGPVTGWDAKIRAGIANHSAYRTSGTSELQNLGKSIGAINHIP